MTLVTDHVGAGLGEGLLDRTTLLRSPLFERGELGVGELGHGEQRGQDGTWKALTVPELWQFGDCEEEASSRLLKTSEAPQAQEGAVQGGQAGGEGGGVHQVRVHRGGGPLPEHPRDRPGQEEGGPGCHSPES